MVYVYLGKGGFTWLFEFGTDYGYYEIVQLVWWPNTAFGLCLSQEECDVLILVLSKNSEPIALSDFRAVMLATLRLAMAGICWNAGRDSSNISIMLSCTPLRRAC